LAITENVLETVVPTEVFENDVEAGHAHRWKFRRYLRELMAVVERQSTVPPRNGSA
jgi:hypothetical protein